MACTVTANVVTAYKCMACIVTAYTFTACVGDLVGPAEAPAAARRRRRPEAPELVAGARGRFF